MTREEALKAWEQMYSEIDKDNWLFVGTINPQMVEWAIKALADRKTENNSEKSNNSTISKMEQVDEPQTCDTCKYGEDKHKYAHICNECGVGINNYEPRTERNE